MWRALNSRNLQERGLKHRRKLHKQGPETESVQTDRHMKSAQTRLRNIRKLHKHGQGTKHIYIEKAKADGI